ncbi:MAG TPA: hypothetical protein VKF37_03740, partial [Chloroflexota bacterium]|nr:hypothetical protein [Chloroflexota bacterium]
DARSRLVLSSRLGDAAERVAHIALLIRLGVVAVMPGQLDQDARNGRVLPGCVRPLCRTTLAPARRRSALSCRILRGIPSPLPSIATAPGCGHPSVRTYQV